MGVCFSVIHFACMWVIFSLLAAVAAALVAIFGKMGLKEVDSTLATTLRAFVMAGLMLSVSLALGKFKGFSLHALQGKEWLYVFLAGLAGAASWLFYFLALKHGDASRVSAIDRTSIFLVVILSVMFLGESFKWKSLIGAILVVIGAIAIAW